MGTVTTTPKPAVTTTAQTAEHKTATYAGQSLGTQPSSRPSFLNNAASPVETSVKPAYTTPVTTAQTVTPAATSVEPAHVARPKTESIKIPDFLKKR